MINGADSYPLLAVPFFLLAGEIMNVGGLSRRIVDLALALVGHIKGGLGYVTHRRRRACSRRCRARRSPTRRRSPPCCCR